jgi:cyclase
LRVSVSKTTDFQEVSPDAKHICTLESATLGRQSSIKVRDMLRNCSRGFLAVAALVVAETAPAQPSRDLSDTEITTTKIASDFYTLEGPGGTISALVSEDGVLLVDSEYAALTGKVIAAIAKLSNKPIRFVVNTHLHADHTGGNENFAKLGAVVFGRSQLRERLEHPSPASDGTPAAAAAALALPLVTYDGPVSIHLGGENVRLMPIASAHTDGDTLVLFPKHDILAVGDYYRGIGYPFADLKRGGSLQGILDALSITIRLAGSSTKIIPGHGPIAKRSELIDQRNILLAVRNKVQALVDQNKTLEEVLAAKLTAEFDAQVRGDRNAAAFVTGDEFVTWVYKALRRDAQASEDRTRAPATGPGPDVSLRESLTLPGPHQTAR